MLELGYAIDGGREDRVEYLEIGQRIFIDQGLGQSDKFADSLRATRTGAGGGRDTRPGRRTPFGRPPLVDPPFRDESMGPSDVFRRVSRTVFVGVIMW